MESFLLFALLTIYVFFAKEMIITYFSVCGEPIDDDDEDEDKLEIEDEYREDLTIKNLPWMVSIGFFESPNKWQHNCGGSLITHR